jgi:hypothetical protein
VRNLEWVMDESFWAMRFYDTPNLLIRLLFVLVVCRLIKVKALTEMVLVGHCFLPLF